MNTQKTYFVENKEITEQVNKIKRIIRGSMNGITVESMTQKGIHYKANFGVALPRLREIASQYEPNMQLATQLWFLEMRESMIIGSMSVVVEATDLYSVTYSLSTDRIGRSEDVTADSSIKDTDIPQKSNIVRDQLYRDYIEVGYTKDYTCDTSLFMGSPSTQLASLLVFNDDGCGFNLNCVAYIKGVDSASTVYYRAIDAIEYDLCKAKLLVADFQDNNHLGYYRERKIV